jgi:integrase
MPARRRGAKDFEIGGQWIGSEPGRPGLYRYWYDAGTGKTARARLEATDPELAKLELAQLVLAGAPKTQSNYLATILESYFVDVTDCKPSKAPARRAGAIVDRFFEDVKKRELPRVADLDEATQLELIAWCAVTLGHSVKTISRNMSVVAAAIAHAKIAGVDVIYAPGKVMRALERKGAPAREEQRRFIPSDAELARFLEHAGDGRLFRACIIMLNTGCRPEAALELTPAQINSEVGILELNPEGRRQTKKWRPIVRVPKNLAAWLEAWKVPAEERIVGYADVDSLQSAITRARVPAKADGTGGAGLPRLVAYSLRHKLTSVLRRSGVPEDQIAVQLGHKRPHVRTTGLYGDHAPDYLQAAQEAIDAFLVRLDSLTGRALFPPLTPAQHPQTERSVTALAKRQKLSR